jgi:predicted nucleotidyltransferase
MDAVHTVCTVEGIDFFIVGALARDLIFEHQHDIATVRSTRDIDVAVIVADWDEYRGLSARLIREHGFRETDRPHRLEAPSGTPLDLIPFGTIETPDRAIGWPPDEAFMMSTLGFREVYEFSLTGIIDGDYGIQVASLPGLSILKLLAWRDRRYETGKDAQDFCSVVVNYAEVIGDALYEEHNDLLDEAYDEPVAAARILGRDSRPILRLSDELRDEVVALLEEETDDLHASQLARAMGRRCIYEIDRRFRCLESYLMGITES